MYKQREILLKIDKFLDKQINLLFLGSRQVGKTVILRLIQQKLLDKQIAAPQQVFFFDLEKGNDLNKFSDKTPDEFISQLYAISTLAPGSPLFVFIDEIQYLPRASSFLKIIADHFSHVRLFMSGSSSLDIKRLFTDRLTGRKVVFHVNTLSFREYLDFQNHPLKEAWQKIQPLRILQGDLGGLQTYQDLALELKNTFEQFVIYGGYPRLSLAENISLRDELLGEIRDQYARRDVRDILNIENVAGFNLLLGLLAAQVGNLVNVNELTNSAKLNRQTVEKYLFLLQETFILKLLAPYFGNPRQELTKMTKVYFYDTGLRNTLIAQTGTQPLELRPDMGALAENAVWHELNTLGLETRFWRTTSKSEVDFVISVPDSGLIPVEVKYQSMNRPVIHSGLISFIKKYKPPHALVLTKDLLDQSVIEKTPIYFVPVSFI